MNKVLVVAVHPDDETIGCGGTLLKLKAAGAELHWLIVTSISEKFGYDRAMVHARAAEIDQVGLKYGFSGIHCLKFPAAQVDTVPLGEVVGGISEVIREVAPEVLFLPFRGDVHSDHRLIFDAAFSCTKSFRHSSIRRVYMMETISETEYAPAIAGQSFVPNSFVDVSDFFEKKLEILNIYASELGEHPFPRSELNIRALGTFRGATSGYKYAESFMLLKESW